MQKKGYACVPRDTELGFFLNHISSEKTARIDSVSPAIFPLQQLDLPLSFLDQLPGAVDEQKHSFTVYPN